MSETVINQTSSVGAAWPPAEGTNNRIRGFYDGIVRGTQEIDEILSHYDRYTGLPDGVTDGPDRVSIRAVTDVRAISELEETGITLEGALPIRGHEDLWVVYTAWNAAHRQASPDHMTDHHQRIAQTAATPAKPELVVPGCTPQVIDQTTPEKHKARLVEQFVDLYGAFGYDEADVTDLLMNPANTIAYLEDEAGIVSTAMAERAIIDVDGLGSVRIAEITEAATRIKDRGRGLYRKISGLLARQLVDPNRHEHLDVVYGESNLAVPGVLLAAHHNGRRFSHLDRARLGIQQEGFGILTQNFKVEDGEGLEVRPYNDFALTYLPLD